MLLLMTSLPTGLLSTPINKFDSQLTSIKNAVKEKELSIKLFFAKNENKLWNSHLFEHTDLRWNVPKHQQQEQSFVADKEK